MKLILLCLFLTLAAAAMPQSNAIPRPEHPRPDFKREQWLNLNGQWEFAETNNDTDKGFLTGKAFPDKITVPFARESRLSGLERTGFVKNVWYRRTFEIPKGWDGKRVRLHVGASDWRTEIYINGKSVKIHEGGSAAFWAEITSELQPGKNTVVIHAFDDTRSRLQALGKQALTEKSESIFYTRTTGIWQTVWLEAVGDIYVKHFTVEPDVPGKRFILGVETDGWAIAGRHTVTAKVIDGEKVVAQGTVPAGKRPSRLVLPIANPKLWQVGSPHLYRLVLEVNEGKQVLDRVDSYAGMRSVEISGRSVLINGKRVYQRLVLDQGFFPDGVWTAPSDDALKGDIELSMAAGFNGARLHQKVFEPRFLYWADKMGYLCWGEAPTYGMMYGDPRVDRPVIEEWAEVLRRDINHPAIIGWCPFNETADDAVPMQNTTVRLTWAIDPTRPVIDSSGWVHGLPEAEMSDAHDYDQNPESFKARWMTRLVSNLPARYSGSVKVPYFISEFGGIGWNTGEGGWGYGNAPKTLDEFYTRFDGLIRALADNPAMFGFCYTQLTDVEQERNGLYTYDRKPKFDLAKIRKSVQAASAYELTGPGIAQEGTWQVLVPSARDESAGTWQYTTAKPADNFAAPTFDDSKWKSGRGGFGRKDEVKADIHTPWTTDDIWLRREFNFAGGDVSGAILAIHFDNAAEVYVNGVEIWRSSRGGWNDSYDGIAVGAALSKAIKTGKNVIAVHCHQETGGQFIDLALIIPG